MFSRMSSPKFAREQSAAPPSEARRMGSKYPAEEVLESKKNKIIHVTRKQPMNPEEYISVLRRKMGKSRFALKIICEVYECRTLGDFARVFPLGYPPTWEGCEDEPVNLDSRMVLDVMAHQAQGMKWAECDKKAFLDKYFIIDDEGIKPAVKPEAAKPDGEIEEEDAYFSESSGDGAVAEAQARLDNLMAARVARKQTAAIERLRIKDAARAEQQRAEQQRAEQQRAEQQRAEAAHDIESDDDMPALLPRAARNMDELAAMLEDLRREVRCEVGELKAELANHKHDAAAHEHEHAAAHEHGNEDAGDALSDATTVIDVDALEHATSVDALAIVPYHPPEHEEYYKQTSDYALTHKAAASFDLVPTEELIKVHVDAPTAKRIADLLRVKDPKARANWDRICLIVRIAGPHNGFLGVALPICPTHGKPLSPPYVDKKGKAWRYCFKETKDAVLPPGCTNMMSVELHDLIVEHVHALYEESKELHQKDLVAKAAKEAAAAAAVKVDVTRTPVKAKPSKAAGTPSKVAATPSKVAATPSKAVKATPTKVTPSRARR